LQELRTQWSTLKNQDIPELNNELTKSGFPRIDADKPPSKQPDNAPAGDDEP
jgi:hypothetical protein